MFAIFKSAPMLDEASRNWLFDCFDWALQHFNAEHFFKHSELVLPNSSFFPQQGDNPQALTQQVFDQVLKYAGVADWPFSLVPPQHYQGPTQARLNFKGPMRSENSLVADYSPTPTQIQVTYKPAQLKQPQALLADLVYTVSYYGGVHIQQAPPGGDEYWPQAIEVLGVFMGFGVMFANSAYSFRGSCARCHDPASDRQAALPEVEICYALALFVVLKGLDIKQIKPYLKSHLYTYVKRAVKDIHQAPEELARLRQHQND